MSEVRFPFAAVVGQDDAKLALQLLAVDPLIGGVLLRGEKGSAKTTLARGLADLLGPDARFVDLPLGATEDRVIGTIDVAKMLVDNDMGFSPGLLAAANEGVLYVDEINLLADHLVDTLLDVSVSGVNRVERDGMSHQHDARFVLIGSMNPEEGELRPQLLDRFGLSVQVVASVDPTERAEAVRRRLDFDAATTEAPAVTAETDRLQRALVDAAPAAVPDDLIAVASRLALAVGAEGLRADIVLCRAAAAHAGLHGRAVADESDLRRVAPLVLAHRSRRNPFDPPMLPPDELADAIDDALESPDEPPPNGGEQQQEGDSSAGPPITPDSNTDPDDADGGDTPSSGPTMAVGDDRRPPSGSVTPMRPKVASVAGRRSMAESTSGRLVRDVPYEPETARPIAVAATVRRLAERRGTDAAAQLDEVDLRHAVRERPSGSLLILVVDTSGSMGAQERAELATGTAFGLLADAYERRDHVALVTFAGEGAHVALAPTGSVEVARNRLSQLDTGGTTPLAAGLREALALAQSRSDQGRTPFVVVISDGRANGAADAVDDALEVANEIRRAKVGVLVLDCETSVPRLGLASRIAEAMAGPCVSATDLDAETATAAIRSFSQEMLDAR